MTDIFIEPRTHGTVYGLFASDEPLQIRYVGMTTVSPLERLRSHHSKTGRRVLGHWFDEVQHLNARVGLRVLGTYPLASLAAAERQWIGFWLQWCILLNPLVPQPFRHLRTVIPARRPTDYGGWSAKNRRDGRALTV